MVLEGKTRIRGGIHPRLVDQHGRVVLTKEAMNTLGAEPGDHVHFVVTPDGRVELRKVKLALE